MGKKVVHLKDYRNSKQTSLRGKIVVGSDVQPQEAVELALQHKDIQVVVSEKKAPVSSESDKQKFFKNPEECLIDTQSDKRSTFKESFVSGDDKKEFLSRVENFLSSSQFRRVRDDIYLIADELYTNFSRTALDKKQFIDFVIDCDESNMIVYCRDPFGSLDPDIMLKNIKRCFDKGVKNSIRLESSGGAGIGSYLMFTVSQGMTIAVQPGKQTLVLIWMPKMEHHEDRIEMKKDLCIIRDEEE